MPSLPTMMLWSFLPLALFARSLATDFEALHNERKVDIRFRFECNQVTHARVDSVVNPGTCAGHMHTFFGNAHIDKVIEEDYLTNDVVTTCTVDQGSLYWVPSLYHKDADGKYNIRYAGVVVYYEFPRETGETVNPIPVGFRQLVGDASRSDPYPDPPDQSSYWPYFTCYTAADEEIVAMSIEDLAEAGRRCKVIEATIIFRDCLTGPDAIDSPNHKDHAMYAAFESTCPSSHPYRIPRVRMEVNYQLDLSFDLADVVLSTGKPSHSMHGDYMAGWGDSDKLINAINSCELLEEGGWNDECTIREEIVREQVASVPFNEDLLPDEPVTGISSLRLTETHGCPFDANLPPANVASKTRSVSLAQAVVHVFIAVLLLLPLAGWSV